MRVHWFGYVLTAVEVVHLVTVGSATAQELQVPAYTAYIMPDPEGARVREPDGVSDWNDPRQSVNWFGLFRHPGALKVRVEIQLSEASVSGYRLTIGDQHREVIPSDTTGTVGLLDFGAFEIAKAGYHRISLQSLCKAGTPLGEVRTLLVSGRAVAEAHFNLKERRNAASVHLMYPVPERVEVQAFYCEVTAIEDPITTFYMACGWHRGYFGMQVNGPRERRIIFSVWDSGDEAVDRGKVIEENRVRLVEKGEGVFAGDFGNEGTGGHSHLKVMWKTGTVQRFLVTATQAAPGHTVFAGHWFHPDQQKWMLISSWDAPKEGGWLRGLHSFSENFSGQNGHLLRKAMFGHQWMRTTDGDWIELTTAKFSHDPTGKTDRFDRYMGLENNQFFLSHGGFLNGFSEYGEKFERKPSGVRPPDLDELIRGSGK